MIMGDSTEQSLRELVELQKQQLLQNQQMAASQQANANTNNQVNQASQANQSVSYMPPMVSFTQQTQQSQAQFSSYANQLQQGSGRYGFFDTIYPDASRVSNQTRQQMAADYGGRLGNATISGAGALLSTGADMATGAMTAGMGFIPSIAAGTVAGAVVGGIFDIGLDQAKQSQAYNKYLLNNSYKFINPINSTNERDIAGFNQGERHEASNFLRHLNTDYYMDDSEISQLTQKFTEGGLLKDTKNLSDFKDRMKSLTSTVKEGALLLNETYGNIADLMSEMKKAGIADKNFDPLMSKSKVVGSMLGMSASQALQQSLQAGQSLSGGTQYSTDMLTSRYQNGAIYEDARLGQLREKQNAGTLNQEELKELNSINNMGGAENTAYQLTDFQNQLLSANGNMMANDAILFFDYNSKDKSFNFNKDKFNQFKNGNQSLEQLTQQVTKTFDGIGKEGQQQWFDQGKTYAINNLNFDDMYRYSNRFFDATRQEKGYGNFTNDQIMSLFKIADSPQRTAYAGMLDYYKQDGGKLRSEMDSYAQVEDIMAGVNMNNTGVFGEVKNQWEKFKDAVGDPFQAVSDKITDWTQGVQDWMYGKKYTRADLQTMTKYGYSAQDFANTENKVHSSVTGAVDTLNSMKKNGMYVDDGLLGTLNDISGMNDTSDKSSDWQNKYIKEARTTFTSTDGLEQPIKEKYKLLSDQADKNNLSETILAALMKYAQQSGSSSTLGMNQSMLDEASKTLGKKAMGAGDQGLTDGSDYLGKLNTLYGGNQNLALSAFFSSQQDVDAALRNQGVDVTSLRNGGNINSLQSVDYKKLGLSSSVTNQVGAVAGAASDYQGGPHDGVVYAVTGSPVPTGAALYDKSYDYQKSGKKDMLADTNNGVDIYDLIHYNAEKKGISANALASVVAVESSGNINSTSSAGAQGLMQIMPTEFAKYVGKTITLPDGTQKQIGSGDIKDPYVNMYVGTEMYGSYLEKYKNPIIAYGVHNGGEGFADQLAKYAKTDYGIGAGSWGASTESDNALSQLTYQQMASIMKTHNPTSTWVSETIDKALPLYMKAYGEGLIIPDSVKKTAKPTTKTETEYVDEKDGHRLSDQEVADKITTNLDLGADKYLYHPQSLSSLDKLVDNSKDSLLNRAASYFDPSKLSYVDAQNYYSTKVHMDRLDEEYGSSLMSKGAAVKQFGYDIADKYKNDTENIGEGMSLSAAGQMSSWVTSGIGNLMQWFGKRSYNTGTANEGKDLKDLLGEQDKLYNAFGSVLNMNKGTGESDLAYQEKVNLAVSAEFNKNQKMISSYERADEGAQRQSTDWMANLNTTQRLQAVDFQRNVVSSGWYQEMLAKGYANDNVDKSNMEQKDITSIVRDEKGNVQKDDKGRIQFQTQKIWVDKGVMDDSGSLFSEEDKDKMKKYTDSGEVNVSEVLKKAAKDGWGLDQSDSSPFFSSTSKEQADKDGKVYVGSDAKVDDLIKSIDAKLTEVNNSQSEGLRNATNELNNGQMSGALDAATVDKISVLLQNPGADSVKELTSMMNDAKGKDGGDTAASNALKAIIDQLSGKFDQSTQSLIGLTDAIKQQVEQGKGYAQATKILSESMNKLNDSPAIKAFAETLSRDSDSMKKANDSGVYKDILSAEQQTRDDMTKSINGILTDNKTAQDNLSKMAEAIVSKEQDQQKAADDMAQLKKDIDVMVNNKNSDGSAASADDKAKAIQDYEDRMLNALTDSVSKSESAAGDAAGKLGDSTDKLASAVSSTADKLNSMADQLSSVKTTADNAADTAKAADTTSKQALAASIAFGGSSPVTFP